MTPAGVLGVNEENAIALGFLGLPCGGEDGLLADVLGLITHAFEPIEDGQKSEDVLDGTLAFLILSQQVGEDPLEATVDLRRHTHGAACQVRVPISEGLESLKQIIDGSFKKLESAAEFEGYVTGVPTGFEQFDRLTAGLQPSDLIIIAGRPSMGKTALALNIGYNAAKKTNKVVAVFSLEMSKQQLGIRLLGFDSGINATKLRTGSLRTDDWPRLTESADRLSELPILIDDTSAIGVLEMKAKCRRLKKRSDLGLVIVDYMQLIKGRRSAESRQLEMSEISASLKGLAKDLNVPVVALSQLNRKVEERPNKRPQLADLRESGAIEQDADVIAFIYRDEVYNPNSEENRNLAEIIIGKQRNGPTGFFKLTFQKELTRFRNYTQEDVPM